MVENNKLLLDESALMLSIISVTLKFTSLCHIGAIPTVVLVRIASVAVKAGE
jgi:hypothetical protein